jgi:hypothetical protein
VLPYSCRFALEFAKRKEKLRERKKEGERERERISFSFKPQGSGFVAYL